MFILSKISLYALQIMILILAGIGTTKGLQYLASESYSPGDTPHAWFRLVVAEKDETTDDRISYNSYVWEDLVHPENRDPDLIFQLPEPTAKFEDTDGGHVTARILREDKGGQLIEIKRVKGDDETVNRYRATTDDITPLYFRRTSAGLAMRGFIVGFLLAGVAGVPLRKLLIPPTS